MKMKMKNIFISMFIIIMMTLSVFGQDAIIDENSDSVDVLVKYYEGVAEPFSWTDLFQSFSFVTAQNYPITNTVRVDYKEGLSPNGLVGYYGASCNVGDYLELVACDGNKANSEPCKRLFTKDYKLEFEADRLNLNVECGGGSCYNDVDWYKEQINNKYVGYNCRTPETGVGTYEYTCINGKISVNGKYLIDCYDTCEINKITWNELLTINGAQSSMCTAQTQKEPVITAVQSTETDIEFGSFQYTNNGELGDSFTVVGNARIIGACDDCVIELGFDYAPYTQQLGLSVEGDRGVCNDNDFLTSGVKFSGSNEWVQYTLHDIATKSGDFQISINAYDKCGGNKLDSISYKLTVLEQPEGEPKIVINIEPKEETKSDIAQGTELPKQDGAEPPLPDPKENEVTVSEQTFVEKYFDFENNPVVAYGLTLFIIIILGLIGSIIFDTSKKGRK